MNPPANAVPAAASPVRPAGVFAGAYLFAGASAFWLTAAIATLFAIPEYNRHYGDLKQDADAGYLAVFLLVGTAVLATLAVGLSALLAERDARGYPVARVLTWIFGGMAVCVAALILLLDLFDAIAWHRWVMNGTAAATLVFVCAAAVLLALPSSGAYFRAAKDARAARRAAIRPAHQPVGYYGAPGYPPAPYPQPVPNPAAQPEVAPPKTGPEGG